MSKYADIVLDLRQKISDGTYLPGDKLPTIPALCAAYGVSKITIKRAMDELDRHGLIARRRGSGTFVKGSQSTPQQSSMGWYSLGDTDGFARNVRRDGMVPSSIVHDFSVVLPDPQIAERLGMDNDEFAYRLCRTRLADGVARMVEYTHLPIKTVSGLRLRHVESSVYDYVHDELGLRVSSAHRSVSAVCPSAQEAAWLDVDTEAALIRVEQVSYLDDGQPLEHVTAIHAPDFAFTCVFSR